MKIYLDFDGTIVLEEYPIIGRYNEGSLETVKKLQDAGHEIILNTRRADFNNNTLEDAIEYLNASDKIDKITKIQDFKIEPDYWDWDIHKRENEIFIDDITPGIPLLPGTKYNNKVDWKRIDEEFKENGLY